MAKLNLKAQVVINNLERIHAKPGDETFELVRLAIIDAVEFYDERLKEWESKVPNEELDEKTIAAGKNAFVQGLYMAESIVHHIDRRMNAK